MEKKEKCAVIFKKPVSYCRSVSALERPVFPSAARLEVASLSQGSVRGGPGCPAVLHASTRSRVLNLCQAQCWAWGAVRNPDLPRRTHRPAWEVGSDRLEQKDVRERAMDS